MKQLIINDSLIIKKRINSKNIDKQEKKINNNKNNNSVFLEKYKHNHFLANDSELKNRQKKKYTNNKTMINIDNKKGKNNNININIINNNNIFLSNNKENKNEIKTFGIHKDKNITKKNYIYLSKEKYNKNHHSKINNINNSKDNNKSIKKINKSKKDENNMINCHNKTNVKKYKHNKSQSQYIHNLKTISESEKKRNLCTDYQSKNYSFKKDKDKLSWALEEHNSNSFSSQRKKNMNVILKI